MTYVMLFDEYLLFPVKKTLLPYRRFLIYPHLPII